MKKKKKERKKQDKKERILVRSYCRWSYKSSHRNKFMSEHDGEGEKGVQEREWKHGTVLIVI